jgi:hypothetical protein
MNKTLVAVCAGLVLSFHAAAQSYAGLPDPSAVHTSQAVAFIPWTSDNTTTFTGTNTAGIGSVLDLPVAVNVQTVDVVLSTAPVGCTTPAIVTLYDTTTTSAEVDSQFRITFVNGQRAYTQDPATPFALQANHSYMWGIMQAAAGCTTNPAAPNWTIGYSMSNADLTVTPTGSGSGGTSGTGATPVVTITNSTDTAQYDKAVCVLTACNPGGNNAPASTAITYQTVSSPPTADTLGMQTTLSTTSSATQTNALWVKHFPNCDSCTFFSNDFWMQPSTNAVSFAANLESDMYMFDSTDGLDFMFGLQCNLSSHIWQIDNQNDSWITAKQSGTNVPCNLTAGTWYHITFKGHRLVGDTACTLANASGTGTTPGPCNYYDSLTVQASGGSATTYVLNQTMRAAFLHTGWSSATGSQKQTDITGASKTVTMLYTADNYTASK